MNRKTETFEAARPQLTGLAYRLLGSISDAQDAVLDTYLKWISHEGEVETPPAWLSRVCTNRCLDQLKSANHTRVDYVGQWIPEQIQTEFEASPEQQLEMASSLTTAFLLVLERLTPKERAAYLLHDIFDKSFDEIADILGMQPANCRKLATRARACVSKNTVRHVPEKAQQENLLAAFQSALQTGDTGALGLMLRADSELRADSGGKVQAVLEVLEGRRAICAFIGEVLSAAWLPLPARTVMINGTLGLLVEEGGQPHAAVSFAYDCAGNIGQVYIMRHPEKLSRLALTRGRAAASGSLIIH